MNKNYIGVVTRNECGDLCLRKEDISKEHMEVLSKLQDMRENHNRTLLDMQNEFVRTFTKKEFFYLCLPYEYSSSYINGIYYPKCFTFDEYRTELESKRDGLRKNGGQRNDEQIEQLMLEYKETLKNSFYYECERYIEGYNFSKTSSLIKSQDSTIMLSTEDIGWTSYEYKVNEDVVVSIHTNFGYGNSSYFFLNLKYKGIDILPYSSIVKYYKANIVELRRHTRQYSMIRDSWNEAFGFVVESANTAKKSPELFVREWIVNELAEMMSGLRYIAQHSSEAINRFIDNRNDNIRNGFCYNVRNIWESEIKDYGVYKNEMNLTFKAEKITGALLLLEKLLPLIEISPMIQCSIDEIKQLNRSLSPELNSQITRIQKEVGLYKQQLVALEAELVSLEEKVAPHNKCITELQEGKSANDKNEIRRKYMMENQEYDLLCSEIVNINENIKDVKTHISKREGFVHCLEECVERIQTYVLAA